MRITTHSIKARVPNPRGRPWDPIGRCVPIVDPESLRIGIDRVALKADRLVHRKSGASRGTWRGFLRGRGAVLLDGERIAIFVPAHLIIEDRPLRCSLDFGDFEEGFHAGVDMHGSIGLIGKKSLGLRPSDLNRGYVAGWTVMEKRLFATQVVEAFNSAARDVARKYPDEHWVEGGV